MAAATQNKAEGPAPSEVSVSVGPRVRMSESETNDLADFAADACEAILALNGRDRSIRKRNSTARPSRIDVVIAGNPEMRRLNRQYRGHDKPTDVISFPVAQPNRRAIEGDIAISAAIAAENARRFGHSIGEELKILVLHGMLHLAGYDHETDGGDMARLEAGLRRVLHLPGTLIARAAQPPTARRRKTPRSAR